MDYGQPEKRKTKKDLKKKRLYRAYKTGGKFRSSDVEEGKNKENDKKGKKKAKRKKKKRKR